MIPRKPSAGEPIDYGTRTQHQLIDAVEDLREQQYSQMPGEIGSNTLPVGNVVKVRNATNSVIPWYGIMELSGSLHNPGVDEAGFQGQIVIDGVGPTNATPALYRDGVIGIAQEPINPGCIGNLLLAGVSQVRLQVGDEDERWATTNLDDTEKLWTGTLGPARILWKESGTGLVWGIVALMIPQDQASWIEFTVNNEAGFDTSSISVTATVIAYHNGFIPDPEVTIVYNVREHTAGTYIFEGADDYRGIALYVATTDKYYIIQMECP